MSRGRSIRRRLEVFVVLAGFLATSCGTNVKLHPVTGQVFFEGEPAEGATVVFHPVNSTPDSLRPGSIVNKEGKFKLRTYPHGEGAPEGEYLVLITWFAPPGAGKDMANAKSRIPLRYSDAAKSGLTAIVKPGENIIPAFELTKKP